MGRRTCGTATVTKLRKDKYAKQFAITEANRKRKRLNHLNRHKNKVRGVEQLENLRKSLNM